MTILSGEGDYTISLSQKDNRFYDENNDIKYSQCRLVIAKKNDDELEFVKCVTGIWKRDTYAELGELQEGNYLIYVSMDWDDNTPEEDRFYNITSYGPESVEFEVLDADSEKGELDILLEIFLDKAK